MWHHEVNVGMPDMEAEAKLQSHPRCHILALPHELQAELTATSTLESIPKMHLDDSLLVWHAAPHTDQSLNELENMFGRSDLNTVLGTSRDRSMHFMVEMLCGPNWASLMPRLVHAWTCLGSLLAYWLDNLESAGASSAGNVLYAMKTKKIWYVNLLIDERSWISSCR